MTEDAVWLSMAKSFGARDDLGFLRSAYRDSCPHPTVFGDTGTARAMLVRPWNIMNQSRVCVRSVL